MRGEVDLEASKPASSPLHFAAGHNAYCSNTRKSLNFNTLHIYTLSEYVRVASCTNSDLLAGRGVVIQKHARGHCVADQVTGVALECSVRSAIHSAKVRESELLPTCDNVVWTESRSSCSSGSVVTHPSRQPYPMTNVVDLHLSSANRDGTACISAAQEHLSESGYGHSLFGSAAPREAAVDVTTSVPKLETPGAYHVNGASGNEYLGLGMQATCLESRWDDRAAVENAQPQQQTASQANVGNDTMEDQMALTSNTCERHSELLSNVDLSLPCAHVWSDSDDEESENVTGSTTGAGSVKAPADDGKEREPTAFAHPKKTGEKVTLHERVVIAPGEGVRYLHSGDNGADDRPLTSCIPVQRLPASAPPRDSIDDVKSNMMFLFSDGEENITANTLSGGAGADTAKPGGACAERGVDEATPDWSEMPACELRGSSRHKLARLDLEKAILAGNLCKDWRGLAELMGYGQDGLERCEMLPMGKRTKELFREWSAQPNTSVADLLSMLTTLGREDIKTALLPNIEDDWRCWKEQRRAPPAQRVDPFQVHRVDPSHGHRVGSSQGSYVEGDVEEELMEVYDVGIICHPDDNEVAECLSDCLERVFNYSVYLHHRDGLADGIELMEMCNAVENRCNSIAVIMSHSLMNSRYHREFTGFAYSLSVEDGMRKKVLVVFTMPDVKKPQLRSVYRMLSNIPLRTTGFMEYDLRRIGNTFSKQRMPRSTSDLTVHTGIVPVSCPVPTQDTRPLALTCDTSIQGSTPLALTCDTRMQESSIVSSPTSSQGAGMAVVPYTAVYGTGMSAQVRAVPMEETRMTEVPGYLQDGSLVVTNDEPRKSLCQRLCNRIRNLGQTLRGHDDNTCRQRSKDESFVFHT
ncbi:PREDICTED: uncharacterized protein LOC106806141 isoform X2 [Priapulus caudatus]|uniref:Uncharacterized protein LOC106806141 isoform X2 n=1 Tax=Priapulus caudatus TaxID=37621 RepID=A0ABM1DU68_PRICU|nr:PREDICTED: uncharacterized protein LOC106806141 isoform X2 [Priapulus caudatus]